MNNNYLYNKIKDEIITLRRRIHMHPELGFEEIKTAGSICDFLKKHNISYTNGIAKTGICAKIGSGKEALLIRADMDALPVLENTSLDFASREHGKMHACGHDIHMASALAAAYMLKQCEDKLKGCVKIVFQPAEETTGGAKLMIDGGVMANPRVTCAIGGHVTPALKTGKMWIKPGALMASPDDFCVRFIGKSTHGAEPENGISPITPAAEFALKIKNLVLDAVDNKDCVLSVCTISGGNSVNIIPDEAKVIGTFRSFSQNERKIASEIIADTAEKIAKKHGAIAKTQYNFLYPPVINDLKITEKMQSIALNLFGNKSIEELKKPLMTGEDFSYFGIEVPSCFVWYGCSASDNSAPLHSDRFEADENAIEVAASLFYEFALNYFLEE